MIFKKIIQSDIFLFLGLSYSEKCEFTFLDFFYRIIKVIPVPVIKNITKNSLI